VGGFLKSGIYPYDPRAISQEKLLQPPTTNTSSEPLARSNSNDDPSLSFNNLSSDTCQSTNRPSSCPNIGLYGKNVKRTFILTTSNSLLNYITSTDLPNQSVSSMSHQKKYLFCVFLTV
jgi:hypothetical protein